MDSILESGGRININVVKAKHVIDMLDKTIMIPIDRKLWTVFENTCGNHFVLMEMINNYIATDVK